MDASLYRPEDVGVQLMFDLDTNFGQLFRHFVTAVRTRILSGKKPIFLV